MSLSRELLLDTRNKESVELAARSLLHIELVAVVQPGEAFCGPVRYWNALVLFKPDEREEQWLDEVVRTRLLPGSSVQFI